MWIGNDIVDLRDAETQPGAAHPRFAARVCRPEELAAIERAASPTRALWMHWAAKESAFKALRKQVAELRFLPRRFAVDLGAARRGAAVASVRIGAWRAAVRIRVGSDYLHAVARVDMDGATVGAQRRAPVASAVRRTGALPAPRCSAAARALLARALAGRLRRDVAAVEIRRAASRGAPPRVYVDGARAPIDVSLSHHGRFVAVAYAVPPRRPRAARAR
ncbi:MAG: 4'-phosphopantetheinyl transferase superfamily protein [Candidatus Binatia bacterium]